MSGEENLMSSLYSQFATSSGITSVPDDVRRQSFAKETFQWFLLQTMGGQFNLGLAVVQVSTVHLMLRVKVKRTSGLTIRQRMSDLTDQILLFVNGGGYTPPAVVPGDFVQINGLRFVSADPIQYRSPKSAISRDYYIDAEITFL